MVNNLHLCGKCGKFMTRWADGGWSCSRCYAERVARLARLNAFFVERAKDQILKGDYQL